MEKVSIKENYANRNLVDVKMTITKGKVLAILHALENYDTPVGKDMLLMFQQALKNSNGDSIVH